VGFIDNGGLGMRKMLTEFKGHFLELLEYLSRHAAKEAAVGRPSRQMARTAMVLRAWRLRAEMLSA
jgi:hypothetical protein